MTTLVWFRDDLRLEDHDALAEGAADEDGIVALYVLDEESPEARPLGGAARWWLHESLTRLEESLAILGIPLVLRAGAAESVVPAVAREIGADRVVWNRRYGAERRIDARIKVALREDGRDARSFPGNLLFEPWTVSTRTGGPYPCLLALLARVPLDAGSATTATKARPPRRHEAPARERE